MFLDKVLRATQRSHSIYNPLHAVRGSTVINTDIIATYAKTTFSATTRYNDSITHDIYTKGSGAPVILLQELPGISDETFRLADKFIDAGFTVVMPHLFGPIGKIAFISNTARIFCMRKEFRLFEKNKSSPIVDWLKALCAEVKQKHNAEGVGMVGMCLTGNFAMALMADENVLATVASQPSLPLLNPNLLQLSGAEIEGIKDRIDSVGVDDGSPLTVLRFKEDKLSTREKLNTVEQCFNTPDHKRVNCVELPGKGHSVLSLDFVDESGHPTYEALETILNYFKKRVK
jgi:dienelactone hydrolase